MKRQSFIALILISALLIHCISANGSARELPVISDNPILNGFSTEISCKAYVLYEMNSGKLICGENVDEKLAPASITKIMTLILIYDAISDGRINLTDNVTVSAHAASMGGSQIFLEEGETLSVKDMIKSIVIASANDACVAMAEFLGGTESTFVGMMNTKAKELGMNNTNFINACGLDAEGHYSSAYDIALMSEYLIENYPEIKEYTLTWMDTIIHKTSKGEKEFGLTNTNKLIKSYDGITGLKTGSTSDAGYSVSATAERENCSYVAVVLGADTTKNRFTLAADLLNYGFVNFKSYIPDEKKLTVTASFENSKEREYKLVAKVDSGLILDKSFDIKSLKLTYEITNSKAPISTSESCGFLIILNGDEELIRYPLYPSKDIEKVKYTDYLMRLLKEF